MLLRLACHECLLQCSQTRQLHQTELDHALGLVCLVTCTGSW